MKIKHNLTKHQKRTRRVRAKIKSTANRPRLHVYRSNKYLYAQIIDDQQGKTIVAVAETKSTKGSGTKSERAQKLGETIAKKAVTKKIKAVVFDRGGNRYHGRIKAFAQSAREHGLNF